MCHRCDNPKCFNPSHLFLGTPRDNAQDCLKKGRWTSLKGTANANAKLTDESVRLMREMKNQGASTRELAAMFSVSDSLVSVVVRRKKWAHVE